MDNEEIQGVKFSEFQSATPDNADEVVGLHAGNNARFSVTNFILAIRQGLTNLFVPTSRTVNGKALSSDITLDASDVGAVDADDVGVAGGVASLGNDGKVPSAQLPAIASTAADVTYDNTQSGLTADDVQEAIDELAAGGSASGKADQTTIAPVEASTTATVAHPLGSIFYLSGVLYRALSDIGVGDTINTGSGGNATQTTVALNFKRVVTLTSVQYTALSAAEKAADIVYIVTDDSVDYVTPENIAKKLSDPAGQNVAAGEYVSYNGNIYTANTAISSSMAASTFIGYLDPVSGGGMNKIQTDFHASASMVGLVDCNSCTTPLAVYQLLIASPNATGFGSIGNQQSSQLKAFLANPFANYTNVTFQFVSTGLICCVARNASDGTVLGKVCYLKGMINNPSNAWTVTDWEEITETIGHKDVEIGTSTLGTTFSQTARVIGSASNLFGVAADKILSISIRDAALNPASILVYGFYSGNFYLAATQSCTLSSSVKFHVTYAV